MLEKIKAVGIWIMGLAIFIGVLAIPLIFIMGSIWASTHLLPKLIALGWLVLAIDIVIFLPLSLIRSLRVVTGGAIYLSSMLFGLITWLLGFIVTYILWGIFAVIIGLLFLGGGVIPIALLAAMFKGEWEIFFILIGAVVVTFGARIVGIIIVSYSEKPESLEL
jgi:hypothetical protein